MKYIPFGPTLQGLPNIMVDSGRTPDTLLELSHWPGNRTPAPWKADLSAESVVHFLRSGAHQEYLQRAQVVSNDHYDVDGLLSLWLMLEPERGLELAELVVDTAVVGDFDRFTTPQAVQACLALYALEQHGAQPIMAGSGWSTDEVTAFLYRRLLGAVEECLVSPHLYQHLWADQYRHIERSREALAAGKARLTEIPELDLAVVESESPLHDYAVYEATRCLRVLTAVGQTYSFRYRYESFVDMVSRRTEPRIRLEPLVKRLNEQEGGRGRWAAETVASAHPRLQLYSAAGAPSASSIPPERFLELLLEHLTLGRQDRSLQWYNTDEWVTEDHAPVPPSLLR